MATTSRRPLKEVCFFKYTDTFRSGKSERAASPSGVTSPDLVWCVIAPGTESLKLMAVPTLRDILSFPLQIKFGNLKDRWNIAQVR